MSINVKGVDKLLKKLDRLERKGARSALRKATSAGTTVLRAAVKSGAPVDEGLLKKAEDSKVGGRGLQLYGIAGANVAKLNADAQASNGKRPTNIDWLVENGHVTPGGKFVPPSGFMRRAAASATPAAEARFVDKLATEIEREATR